MAGSATDFAENAVAAYLFGAVSLSLPANWFIGAYTVAPGETGGGTEVTGGSYARVSVANTNVQWTTTASVVVNANAIVFVTATANWGVVNAITIHSAVTAGNLWFYSTITPTTINTGDTLTIAATTLSITVA